MPPAASTTAVQVGAAGRICVHAHAYVRAYRHAHMYLCTRAYMQVAAAGRVHTSPGAGAESSMDEIVEIVEMAPSAAQAPGGAQGTGEEEGERCCSQGRRVPDASRG